MMKLLVALALIAYVACEYLWRFGLDVLWVCRLFTAPFPPCCLWTGPPFDVKPTGPRVLVHHVVCMELSISQVEKDPRCFSKIARCATSVTVSLPQTILFAVTAGWIKSRSVGDLAWVRLFPDLPLHWCI